MLGYVALPTFGEVDDNAPAEQALCDLVTIETKFPNKLFLSVLVLPCDLENRPTGRPMRNC